MTRQEGGGKYGRLAGSQYAPSSVVAVKAWCYICARRNRHAVHTWAEHQDLERKEKEDT